MKSLARCVLRKAIRAREYETIHDAMNRNIVTIQKLSYRKRYSKLELKKALIDLGIAEGDILMVHASWRQFYLYDGTPEEVIKMIREIIGPEGTILMPSYGVDKLYFDVENTPSNAGVISEVFRKMPNVYRSASTHFSVCAQGLLGENLTKDHQYSEYGFDYFSPYYKFSSLKNAKILFIGLGKKPTKISLFHCVGYMLKEKDPFLEDLINEKYTATLVTNGQTYTKKMITRKPTYSNNNKVFKKILASIHNRHHIKLSNLDLVVIDANEGLQKALDFGKKRVYCYK